MERTILAAFSLSAVQDDLPPEPDASDEPA
jgi:hypothetical protein